MSYCPLGGELYRATSWLAPLASRLPEDESEQRWEADCGIVRFTMTAARSSYSATDAIECMDSELLPHVDFSGVVTRLLQHLSAVATTDHTVNEPTRKPVQRTFKTPTFRAEVVPLAQNAATVTRTSIMFCIVAVVLNRFQYFENSTSISPPARPCTCDPAPSTNTTP